MKYEITICLEGTMVRLIKSLIINVDWEDFFSLKMIIQTKGGHNVVLTGKSAWGKKEKILIYVMGKNIIKHPIY